MLKENPSYVLDIPMSASRKEISNKAEEQSFFLDAEKCNEAQAVLTNPAKRLNAEINWFPGESENEIAKMRKTVLAVSAVNY